MKKEGIKVKTKNTKSTKKNNKKNLNLIDNKDELNNDKNNNLRFVVNTYLGKDILEDLDLRLRKIEGQIKGIKNMLKSCKSCNDILIQIMAVRSALNSVAIKILEGHIEACIKPAVKNNNYSILNNFLNSLKKIFKEVK